MALYDSGKTQGDIAKEMGLTRQRVHQLLNQFSPSSKRRLNRRGAATIKRIEGYRKAISPLVRSGATGKEIAEQLNVSYSTIMKHVPDELRPALLGNGSHGRRHAAVRGA